MEHALFMIVTSCPSEFRRNYINQNPLVLPAHNYNIQQPQTIAASIPAMIPTMTPLAPPLFIVAAPVAVGLSWLPAALVALLRMLEALLVIEAICELLLLKAELTDAEMDDCSEESDAEATDETEATDELSSVVLLVIPSI